MNLQEKKELLAAQGITFNKSALLPEINKLIADNIGTEEDAERLWKAQIDQQGKTTNGDFDTFMQMRKGGAQGEKITNRAGTGGVNPYAFKQEERVADVLEVIEHVGPKGLSYRVKVAVKGASVGFVYTRKQFQVDDLVIVTCRILPAGVYLDADKDGNQRELVVPTGRKAAYDLTDIKMASIVRVQVAIAMKGVSFDEEG
jgi:hypothetical protein